MRNLLHDGPRRAGLAPQEAAKVEQAESCGQRCRSDKPGQWQAKGAVGLKHHDHAESDVHRAAGNKGPVALLLLSQVKGSSQMSETSSPGYTSATEMEAARSSMGAALHCQRTSPSCSARPWTHPTTSEPSSSRKYLRSLMRKTLSQGPQSRRQTGYPASRAGTLGFSIMKAPQPDPQSLVSSATRKDPSGLCLPNRAWA